MRCHGKETKMLTYAHRNCYRCHGYARQAEYNATVSTKSVGAQVGDSLHWARYEKGAKDNSLEAIQARVNKVSKLRRAMPSEWQRLAVDLSYDVDDLLAEVERLQARPAVDDDMMERATRAFGAATAQVSSVPLGMSEDTFMDSVGLQHLHAIRAALDAAFGTGERA